MATTTVTLPAKLHAKLPTDRVSAALKAAAFEALDAGEVPRAPVADGASVRIGVYLSSREEARLRSAMREHRLPLGVLIAGLANSVLQSEDTRPPVGKRENVHEARARTLLSIPGATERAEQRRFLARALQHDKGVLLLEGSTGVGKSLAIAAAAWEAAGKNSPVVVAAPTHAILKQVADEYRRVCETHGEKPYALLLGRQEFVSQARLRHLLEDGGDLPHFEELYAAANDWMAAADATRDPHGLNWSAESLAEAVPWIDPAAVALHSSDTKEDDAGVAAYREHQARAREAQVVLCSHTMLAIEMRQRARNNEVETDRADYAVYREQCERRQVSPLTFSHWVNDQRTVEEGALLPLFRTLFIDEGHMLEDMFRRALQREWSFIAARSHWREITKLSTGSKEMLSAQRRLEKHVTSLMELGRTMENRDPLPLRGHAGDRADTARDVGRLLRRFEKELAGFIDAAARKRKGRELMARPLAELRDLRSLVRAALQPTGPGNVFFGLNWSPARHYPRLFSIPRNVYGALDMLWHACPRAIVTSATLYVPGPGGEMSAALMAETLSIRRERLVAAAPVKTDWLVKPVTVHLPELLPRETQGHWLQPANWEESEVAESEWTRELANVLEHIATGASGGVLALCTSYRTAEALGTHLRGSLGDRLLVAGDEPFTVQRARYLHAADAGARPVWLGVGRSWTGVDLSLSHRPPEEDQAVSDLVITRLPFRVKETDTGGGHDFWRSLAATALTLRQGMGRLVRRPGVKDKHLWILDARLQFAQSQFSFLRNTLLDYRQTERFAKPKERKK